MATFIYVKDGANDVDVNIDHVAFVTPKDKDIELIMLGGSTVRLCGWNMDAWVKLKQNLAFQMQVMQGKK